MCTFYHLSECGKTFSSSSGTLTGPQYPDGIINTCEYYITVPTGQVCVGFTDYDKATHIQYVYVTDDDGTR